VTRSIKSLSTLLIQARKHVTAANKKLQVMNTKRNDLVTKEGLLNEKAVTANSEHTKNELALKLALFDDYRTQTSALIVPRITDLHSTFLGFVDRYRAQAGLVSNSPEFIQGNTYRSTRPAMAEIVSSQNRDLLRIKEIIQSQSNFIQSIENELNSLSSDSNSNLTRFGFDHYYTILLERFDAQQEIAQTATVLFNGLDNKSKARPVATRCQHTNLPTFSSNLNYVLSRIGTSYEDFDKSVTEDVSLDFYDGNPTTKRPGYISGWRGCSQNKQNNAENFRRDIERESARGNIELAKQLDFARADLDRDITVINSEAETLQHHSNQIRSVLRSSALQGAKEILDIYPNAWKRTATAHVNNLITENLLYPALMLSSDLLLERALNEIRLLPGITDLQNRRAEMKLVAEKLQSIRLAGFARVLEQIDSVSDQLSTMSLSIGSGESFLEETISIYGLSARTKTTYWKAEQDKLPATLASSTTRVIQTRDNFTKSLELKKATEQIAEQYKLNRETLFKELNLLQDKFGNSNFNPIYSELAARLISKVAKNPQYIAVKPALTSAITNYLSSFQGIKPSALISRIVAKPARKTAKITLPTMLERERKVMMPKLVGEIDLVSQSYLEGRSLSAVLSNSQKIYDILDSVPK
jgi:hypothetical protein